MKIQFQKKDAEYYKIETLRKEIATITCKHPIFIEIVSTILLELYESSDNLTKELDTLINLNKYKVDRSNEEEYKTLKNKLIDYYMLIHDFNFDKNLKKYNPDEYSNYKLYDNQKKMNVFRGILFEAMVEEMVRERFSNEQFSTGCCVIINKTKICIYYNNGKIKETFDIAGWDRHVSAGEFYECKIRPNKFGIENYTLMLQLEKHLLKNKISNYKIIVASADAKNNISQQLNELETKITSKLKKLECYGRDNINKIGELTIIT